MIHIWKSTQRYKPVEYFHHVKRQYPIDFCLFVFLFVLVKHFHEQIQSSLQICVLFDKNV